LKHKDSCSKGAESRPHKLLKKGHKENKQVQVAVALVDLDLTLHREVHHLVALHILAEAAHILHRPLNNQGDPIKTRMIDFKSQTWVNILKMINLMYWV
jgi:hypothetical protein